jgi:hypothetical protein
MEMRPTQEYSRAVRISSAINLRRAMASAL